MTFASIPNVSSSSLSSLSSGGGSSTSTSTSPTLSPEDSWSAFHLERQRSLESPNEYWDEKAKEYLTWFRPYSRVFTGGFDIGDINWFDGGQLNVCYNCVDRHLPARENQTAIIWEADEVGQSKKITYKELCAQICRIANVMKKYGIRKGDVVTIYMPMIPELAVVMLACARIGAVHSVIFAGFSSDSIRGRILNGDSRFVFTADQGLRGGKTIPLKDTINKALQGCPDVKNVFVFKRTGDEGTNMTAGRDVWIEEQLMLAKPVCPCESVNSEDPLLIRRTKKGRN
jgi:acetyl-CoA synthetase